MALLLLYYASSSIDWYAVYYYCIFFFLCRRLLYAMILYIHTPYIHIMPLLLRHIHTCWYYEELVLINSGIYIGIAAIYLGSSFFCSLTILLRRYLRYIFFIQHGGRRQKHSALAYAFFAAIRYYDADIDIFLRYADYTPLLPLIIDYADYITHYAMPAFFFFLLALILALWWHFHYSHRSSLPSSSITYPSPPLITQCLSSPHQRHLHHSTHSLLPATYTHAITYFWYYYYAILPHAGTLIYWLLRLLLRLAAIAALRLLAYIYIRHWCWYFSFIIIHYATYILLHSHYDMMTPLRHNIFATLRAPFSPKYFRHYYVSHGWLWYWYFILLYYAIGFHTLFTLLFSLLPYVIITRWRRHYIIVWDKAGHIFSLFACCRWRYITRLILRFRWYATLAAALLASAYAFDIIATLSTQDALLPLALRAESRYY